MAVGFCVVHSPSLAGLLGPGSPDALGAPALVRLVAATTAAAAESSW